MEKEIKKEWEEYYQYLEKLRRSGVTNMFGASPYLEMVFDLDEKTAINILSNWMHNYDELTKKYNWR